MFPVASAGSGVSSIPELMNIFGKDVIIDCSSGIHSHPMGTSAGTKACRQAIDAKLAGISLEE